MLVVKEEVGEGNPVLCGAVTFFFISIQTELILLWGWKGHCLWKGKL